MRERERERGEDDDQDKINESIEKIENEMKDVQHPFA